MDLENSKKLQNQPGEFASTFWATAILIVIGVALIILGWVGAKFHVTITVFCITFGLLLLGAGILIPFGEHSRLMTIQTENELREKGAWFLVLKFVEKHRELLKNVYRVHASMILVNRIKPENMINEAKSNVDKLFLLKETVDEEFEKLRELLTIKYGIHIERKRLFDALYIALDEIGEQKKAEGFEKYKKIILSERPKTKDNYVDAHLKHYGEDCLKSPYINFLTDLLIGKGFKIDQTFVVDLVSDKKKMLDLEGFEKSLIKREPKEEIVIDLMSGYDFERFLADLYKKMGYNVINTKLSGDQGADLIVERFGEKTVVQAKNYSGSVGNKAIQEAVAAREYYKCNKAIVITTSYFTRQAINAANKTNVELWDRNKLDEAITRYSGTNANYENEEDIKKYDEITTVCKICGVNETNNPDGICDDCKFSIISNKDIPPNM